MAQELMEKKLSMANSNGSSAGAGSLDGLLEDSSLAGETEGGTLKKRTEEGKTAEGTGAPRLPASALVAGMTAQYKGENIGVASDDIFSMVQKRYQLKQEQDSFLIMEQMPSILPHLKQDR
jgi:hypothetical protein